MPELPGVVQSRILAAPPVWVKTAPDWPQYLRSRIGDELRDAAAAILAAREQLGVATDSGAAAHFLRAGLASNDRDDHNRLGARRLAAQLLATIEGEAKR